MCVSRERFVPGHIAQRYYIFVEICFEFCSVCEAKDLKGCVCFADLTLQRQLVHLINKAK